MSSTEETRNNTAGKINRWIDRMQDCFGQKILCSGIEEETAGHLSRMFPGASIVCLTDAPAATAADAAAGNTGTAGPASFRADTEAETSTAAEKGNGASAAAAPADPLSLRVPLWIPGDLQSYEGGLFDTVLAVSTAPLLPEEPGGDFPRWARGTLYLRRASLLMDYFENRAHALRRRLRPGGTLLHLICAEQDEYFLGYCLALAAEEMAVDPASIREIRCLKNDVRLTLQGFAARAGGRTDLSALIAGNLNHSLDQMNTSASEYEGREAEIFLQSDAGELYRGYNLYRGDRHTGKLAIYTSVRNPEAVYYFTDVEGDTPYLRRFHTQDRDTVLRHMVGELHRQKAADKTVRWRQLTQHGDWSETDEG